MGIYDLKAHLSHIPGIEELTMQYGNGGATEIYTMGDVNIEVPAQTPPHKIAEALVNPFIKKKLN